MPVFLLLERTHFTLLLDGDFSGILLISSSCAMMAIVPLNEMRRMSFLGLGISNE